MEYILRSIGTIYTRLTLLRKWIEGLAVASFELNRQNIKSLAAGRNALRICDLGCDDGEWTVEVAHAAGARETFGVEIVAERAVQARKRGVNVVIADLNRALPYRDGTFDLVHANQVIEHVGDLDNFMGEITRVLRTGGVSIISTENGSSWHNVGAAALGWQIFSLTCVSVKARAIGNPLALHRGEPGTVASWTHKTIFNYEGLLEIHRIHGLRPVTIAGAGYHPLSPALGLFDPRHAHLLSVLAVKSSRQQSMTESRH